MAQQRCWEEKQELSECRTRSTAGGVGETDIRVTANLIIYNSSCRHGDSEQEAVPFAEYILKLTEFYVSPLQGVAVDYMLYGYNQVMVRSSRVNVFKAHQVFILLGKKRI